MKKVCPRCKVEYQIAVKHFHKNRLNKDGLTSVCKECKRKENIFIKSELVSLLFFYSFSILF